jgi:hypothetical protein
VDVLGMPWLTNHSLRIDWEKGKITFESDTCTTWCPRESPTVYAIPEEEAREEKLENACGTTQNNKAQRITVKRLTPDARIRRR